VVRISRATLAASLATVAAAVAATGAQAGPHAYDFSVFKRPVDKPRADDFLTGCTETDAAKWDPSVPSPDNPCSMPMRGHSRRLPQANGRIAWVTAYRRYVCVQYLPIAGCRKRSDARKGRMAFVAPNTSACCGPYTYTYVQLVPDWIRYVTVDGKRVRVRHNLAIAPTETQVGPGGAGAGSGAAAFSWNSEQP
jgi:hypothetical protein